MVDEIFRSRTLHNLPYVWNMKTHIGSIVYFSFCAPFFPPNFNSFYINSTCIVLFYFTLYIPNISLYFMYPQHIVLLYVSPTYFFILLYVPPQIRKGNHFILGEKLSRKNITENMYVLCGFWWQVYHFIKHKHPITEVSVVYIILTLIMRSVQIIISFKLC